MVLGVLRGFESIFRLPHLENGHFPAFSVKTHPHWCTVFKRYFAPVSAHQGVFVFLRWWTINIRTHIGCIRSVFHPTPPAVIGVFTARGNQVCTLCECIFFAKLFYFAFHGGYDDCTRVVLPITGVIGCLKTFCNALGR